MKAFFLTFGFFIFVNTALFGQYLSNFTSVVTSNDSAIVYVSAAFGVGSSNNRPTLQSYEITSNNQNIELDLFYNVSGSWPTEGCGRLDTIYISGLSFAQHYNLLIISNSINNSDTTFNFSNLNLSFSILNAQEFHFSNELSFYPNPATEAVTINFTATRAEKSEIEILNSFGRIVKSETIYPDRQEVQIPVSELPAGFYYCKIRTGEKAQVLKFVKQ